ncbi:MAG: glycosyltransferase [Steroidobacteraceae bacterium]
MNTSTQPFVSIIVPVYNGERFLRASLESVLAQDYRRREILLLDDGSTDGTAGIARDYLDRITYIRRPQNLGQFANVNDGIARARGSLIAIFHADDIYDPHIVSRQVAAFVAHPRVGAVFALDVLVDEENREYARLELPVELSGGQPLPFATIFNALLTYKNRHLVTPSAMVLASTYREVGDFDGARWQVSSDLDMWIRVARHRDLIILEEHLIRYRHTESQASRSYQRMRTEPELHFAILDHHLRASGGAQIAQPAALRAHEAHRAEDWTFVAMRRYVLGQVSATRAALDNVSLRKLVASRVIQRARVATLALVLAGACRLPWSSFLAALFTYRWQLPRSQARGGLRKILELRGEIRSRAGTRTKP